MAWVVWVKDRGNSYGQAIGPYAREADADARAEAEVLARGGQVEVTFIVQPDWVKPGENWKVPLQIVYRTGDEVVVRYPFGKGLDREGPPDLDDL
jgi:hypothetical protein